MRVSAQSSMDALMAAMAKPCCCHGEWTPCTRQALNLNAIREDFIDHDLYMSFAHGRCETVPVLVLAGLQGGEGKNLLLSPIVAVLCIEYVLQGVKAGQFPLVDLPWKKAAILNEWHFTLPPLSLGIQLLWLEGKPVLVCRPQNDRD